MSASRFAVALVPALVAVAASARAAPAPARERSYATPLALAYAIPMGIDAAAWGVVALGDINDAAPVTVAAVYVGYFGVPVTWLVPGVVHAASGEPLRGLGSVGGSALGFAGGLILGAPIVLVAVSATTDDAHPWGTAPAWALWPTLGLLGQTVWAVHDVDDNAVHVLDDARAPALHLAGLSVAPRRGGGATVMAAFSF